MKTWLIIVSVVAVLLAASVGVGFKMLIDAKVDVTATRAELTNTKAELTEIQENLEENFGHQPEETTLYPWREPPEGKYPWCEGVEEAIRDLRLYVEDLEWPVGQAGSISDMELRIEELDWAVRDLEWTVEDLEQQLQILESTLHIYGIY